MPSNVGTDQKIPNHIVIAIVEDYIKFWNSKRILTKMGHLIPVNYQKKMTQLDVFLLWQKVVAFPNASASF